MSLKNQDAAVTELALAIGLLIRKIRSTAPSETRELSWTQRSVVARLDKEGPTTIAELARAEGVKPQSMGTAIAELEERGWVTRKPHPTDGRQMNIEFTSKGAATRKSYQDAKHTWLLQAVAKLDKNEQATLFAAGKIIKSLAEL
jgi:DNA-binding MarR family transcriptional regulator